MIGPDATILTAYMLNRLTGIMSRLKVIESNVQRNLDLTRGLVYSSFVLVELMRKGMKRDDAYSVIQENSMKLWSKIEAGDAGMMFVDMLKKDERVTKLISENDMKRIFDKNNIFKNIDLIYKRVL